MVPSISKVAEKKPALIPLMQLLPNPSHIVDDHVLWKTFFQASLQASDQVKAVIKNACVLYDQVIEWLVTVGPYFIIKCFGPYMHKELDTCGSWPNGSGDVKVFEAIM
jgi:hypothetical protein